MKFLEDNLVVNGWTHADINGAGVTSDVVSLKNWNHATIVLDFGNTTAGGDADIVVRAADDVSATHSVAINNFTYRKAAGTTGTDEDVFAASATIEDSKIDYVAGGEIIPDTDDDCLVVIDIDAAEVRAAGSDYEYDCLYVTFGNPGQGCPVGCKFILSQPRYGSASLPTVLED